jgi:hypothetical protein
MRHIRTIGKVILLAAVLAATAFLLFANARVT